MRGALRSQFGAVSASRAATEIQVRDAPDPPADAEDEGAWTAPQLNTASFELKRLQKEGKIRGDFRTDSEISSSPNETPTAC